MYQLCECVNGWAGQASPLYPPGSAWTAHRGSARFFEVMAGAIGPYSSYRLNRKDEENSTVMRTQAASKEPEVERAG